MFRPSVSRPRRRANRAAGTRRAGRESTGWSSNELIQAGVQQHIPSQGAKPEYVAWYQWWIAPPPHNPGLGLVDSNGYPVSWLAKYPYIYQANYKNFPVAPGDQVMTAIVYR